MTETMTETTFDEVFPYDITSYINNRLDTQKYVLGYPCNLAYDYTPLIKHLPNIFLAHFNNIGPVDVPTNYTVHSKDVEKEVLHYFSNLWKFDFDKIFGYVTSCGTEGNEQALYIAREMFPNAVLYFSEDAHYSIRKIAKILKLPFEIVRSQENGEMDYTDFERILLKHGDLPAIITATIGTTMKGAIDDTREIYRIIRKHKKQDSYFLHADGALMGMVLPLFEKDIFFKRYIHSISISGHKFLGVPFPCGIFMLDTTNRAFTKNRIDSTEDYVEYIDCTDCTISGSRSGHAPLFFQYIITTKGTIGFEKDAAQCIENAEYLVHCLNDLEMDAWRNNNSITVIFNKPDIHIIKKWQLASEGSVSHIVVMPHATKTVLDAFLLDLRRFKDTAIPEYIIQTNANASTNVATNDPSTETENTI